MSKQRLVVIGNGMAGARVVDDLFARGGADRFDVVMFGDEPCGNYNRILLSSVLSRSHKPDDIFINPMSWYAAKGITLHAGKRVEQIDLGAKQVKAADGLSERYDTLIIATGSSPVIPPLANVRDEHGAFKQGVFVFRTLDDCERIMRSAETARRAAVIGGGLLGLEAARGLLNWGLETHVIHLMPHLMETQLDPGAADVLRRQFEQMGLVTHLATRTTAVLGNGHVAGLEFAAGAPLECDLVVIAAGIRPNAKIAADAGLKVNRGIVVGDDLGCFVADSPAPDVFAVGECAEHRGRVYGLVAPLWEQTARLADRLSGRNPDAVYVGSSVSTKLKVMGVDLAVMGDKEPVGEDDEVVSYSEPSRGIYKKLIVRNDRLAGAIILGDGAVVPSLLQTFASGMPLAENRSEVLFLSTSGAVVRGPDAAATPDTARICDCNDVSKAQIIEAVLSGARSVQAVCDATRASTGCGSCRPEVEAIVALACQGIEKASAPEDFSAAVTTVASGGLPSVVAQDFLAAEALAKAPSPAFGPDTNPSITLNKIERYKREKDGLDVEADIQRFVRDGWEAIDESDRERLKWLGVFFRRQTPGKFMMRIRMPNGFTNAEQISVIAELSRECGTGFVDLTTRQQIQLRGFAVGDLPHIWERLIAVDLVSLQTGMDNIRNVVGCPVAGLTDDELFDASQVVREFNDAFLRNRAFTNLPRKFNVAITGCTENCTHGETQDLSLTPAIKVIAGEEVKGFNIAVGGKIGSGGLRPATPLGVFCRPEDAAALCSHITLIFRDYGPRRARNRARLAFLIEEWGIDWFRQELERRVGERLLPQGRDARTTRHHDHLGISRQKELGLCAVGLNVPVGRITADQMFALARVAQGYGTGDVRITTSQNVIIPNVPERVLPEMTAEPLLRELRHDPSDMMRGVVSCTGIDYCHMALIETKELALKTARELDERLGSGKKLLTMHWSGCPAGCGNHTGADIGLLGKNVKIGDEIVDAVDVFVGGRSGPNAKAGTKLLEDVPCSDLPRVLEQVIPYVTNKRAARSTKKDVTVSVAAKA
jgi:NAD(P)H-nitrite reductase large subunit